MCCIFCLCCLATQKAKCIEISILISCIILIGCYIWGLLGTPWKYIRKIAKIFYIISLIIAVIDIVSILYLMFLRCNNLINSTRNKLGKIICIFIFVVNSIALILFIISEIIIVYDMDDVEYPYGNGYWARTDVFSDGEWAAALFATSIIELIWFLLYFFWAALYKLISAKTEGPLIEHFSDVFRGKNIISTNNNTAYVIGNDNTAANLVLVGYDQNGSPVYSQQNGNYTIHQNSPIVNTYNNNQIYNNNQNQGINRVAAAQELNNNIRPSYEENNNNQIPNRDFSNLVVSSPNVSTNNINNP